jgi:hypothetical protein
MMEDRFLKRLRKKARKGLRGWPIATIAFYGPNLWAVRNGRRARELAQHQSLCSPSAFSATFSEE